MLGYWLNHDIDEAELTVQQKDILNVKEDEFHKSFLVAGKDIWYDLSKSEPVYDQNGQIVAWNYTGKAYTDGTNTDTILYVDIQDNDVTMIPIPRDIYLPQWQTRINSMYYYQEAEGLVASVEEIIGLPIDYYAILDTTIFANLVDALGGVDIYIPQKMYYRDDAANLIIDFKEGMTYLNGEDAAKFIRYRSTSRGDIGRLDNLKRLANALLLRVKELNVLAVTKLPQLIATFFSDVETNATPALVKDLLPRISSIKMRTATLPVHPIENSGMLTYYPDEVKQFLAETFGGTTIEFGKPPELTLLITNRSGLSELDLLYKEELVALGLDANKIVTREGVSDGLPTYLLTNQQYWQDADYFESLFQLAKQQVDSLPIIDGQTINVELVLGENASQTMIAKRFR